MRTKDKRLQLVDREGSVKDTINTDFAFNDMTVTSYGDLLLTDRDNRCIRCVSKQKTIHTLFRTSWKPSCLGCSHNNDIVVAFSNESKVAVYGRNGQIRRTLDHIKFRYPQSVAVNKVNQDIRICDLEEGYFDSPGKLIAVGADGQLQYEYTGQGDSKFNPVDVCTDQMGHVLIIDYNNHQVHVLDQEGRFIQYLLTSQQGLKRRYTIDVDREGYVWVGHSRLVTVTRYLK